MLHAILDLGITDGLEGTGVELVHAVEHVAAGFPGNSSGVLEEKYRITQRTQRDTGILAGQIAGTPEAGRNGLHVGEGRGVRGMQHDEGWQLLVHRAEAVGQP